MKKVNSLKEKMAEELFAEINGLPNTEIIVLVAMPLAVHKVTGSINFPGDIAGISARARFIYTKSNASTVSFPSGMLTDFLALIVAYETASVDDRPGAFYLMNNKAQAILGIVQPLADAEPLRAIGILHGCGFNVIPAHGAHVNEFTGTASATIPGAIDLSTAGGPENKNHLHIWYTSEDGINWVMKDATTGRKVTVTGFAHGKDIYVKTQLSIQDVKQPESNIIIVLVN